MEIKQILLQPYEPTQLSAIWVKPVDDTIELRVFNNGKWRSTTPSPIDLTNYLTKNEAAATYQPVGDYITVDDIPPLDGYVTEDAFNAHVNDENNPHQVTSDQVGLENVDNTSDLDKPVSTAQQAALDLKQNITDDTFNTTDKTVPGAINELLDKIDNVSDSNDGKISQDDFPDGIVTKIAAGTNEYTADKITIKHDVTTTAVDGTPSTASVPLEIAGATTAHAGVLSSADKQKLDAIDPDELITQDELEDTLPKVIEVPELTAAYTVPANDTLIEYTYLITIGATVYNVSADAAVKWAGGVVPTPSPNSMLVVSVLKNLATWQIFM